MISARQVWRPAIRSAMTRRTLSLRLRIFVRLVLEAALAGDHVARS
jgi:hypothetical protein